jgi:hypothetical protein
MMPTTEVVELALESGHYGGIKADLISRVLDLVFEVKAHTVFVGRTDYV